MLYTLFTFYKSLVECTKFPVRFLANLQADDMRSVLGRNVAALATICDLPSNDKSGLSAALVKKKMVYQKVDDNDAWIVNLATELADMTNNESPCLQGFLSDEIKEMLDYVCTI